MLGFNNPNQPMSVEMVMIDEFGGKIQTSVRKTLIYKFLPLLVEGGVYKMSYFSVAPNTGSYRVTTHGHRLVSPIRPMWIHVNLKLFQCMEYLWCLSIRGVSGWFGSGFGEK